MEGKDKLSDAWPALPTSEAPVDGTSGVAEAGRGGAAAATPGQDEDQEDEEEEEEATCVGNVPLQPRAPDGGWGWMVALGTFIIQALFFTLPYCFGILFSGFLVENGASSTTTAWIYNLYLVIWNLSTILVNPLCQEFGQRIIGFIGVFLMSVSIILSGFSHSIAFMYFSFSLLGGVSTGISMSISFMVLPPYFHKKSGLANTFMVTGGPVAQIAFGPLVRYLLAVYSFKGAALIHGAILLNGLIAVSFFHPIKWHLKPSPGGNPRLQQSLMPRDNAYLPTSTKTSHIALVSRVPASTPSTSFVVTLWRTLLRVVNKTKSDVTVLRQLRCVILSVTMMLTRTTMFNFIMMLPFVAQAADYSLQDAALCMSLLGIANLVTRLVVSPLSDLKKFSVRYAIMLGYFLKASGIIVATLGSELWHLMVSGVVSGMGMGLSLALYNPSIVKYMGMAKLGPTIGMNGLVCAIGSPILGPLIGVIRDTTNSYLASLCVMVMLDLLSVALWGMMPAAQARDSRMDRRRADRS